MSLEAAVTGALGRSALYRLLATAFTYPTPARLEAVAAGARQTATGALAELRAGLDRLADAAGHADVGALAGEHVALFQREVRCPPYEGAYGPAQMAGKAALLADVAGFYRAFALEPAAGQPEVEDHVCVELEFMSALALKEAWAVANGQAEGLEVTLAAQRAFLTDHLARWIRAFAERVMAAATPGVLPAAAALLQAWIQADCARLGIAPRPLEGVNEAEASAFACPMAPAAAESGSMPGEPPRRTAWPEQDASSGGS
jgi:DMSO reductase family type II enzyme chaperone